MHVLHHQHTFVLTGLPGLLLLALLLMVFVLGSVDLLVPLARGVRAFRGSGGVDNREAAGRGHRRAVPGAVGSAPNSK